MFYCFLAWWSDLFELALERFMKRLQSAVAQFSYTECVFYFQLFKKFCQNPNKNHVWIVYIVKRKQNNENSLLKSVAVYMPYTVASNVQSALFTSKNIRKFI